MNETIIRLHNIAIYLEKKIKEAGFDMSYEVQNIYEDFGLETMHDTIVASDVKGNSTFQILSNAELEKIRNNTFKQSEIDEIVQDHIDYCNKWNISRLN